MHALAIFLSAIVLMASSASAQLVMRIDTENNFFYLEGTDSGNADSSFDPNSHDIQFYHAFASQPSASAIITNTPEDLFLEKTTLPINFGGMNMISGSPSYVFIDLNASSNITTLTGQGSSVTISYASLPAVDQLLFESMIGKTMSLTIGNGYSPISVQATPTLPDAPTITGISEGNGQLSVAFTPGANNGSAITNYEYSLNGGAFVAFNPAVTSSPLVISGLNNGTTYAVVLKAVNSVGAGASSNSVSGSPIKPPDKIFHSRFAVID